MPVRAAHAAAKYTSKSVVCYLVRDALLVSLSLSMSVSLTQTISPVLSLSRSLSLTHTLSLSLTELGVRMYVSRAQEHCCWSPGVQTKLTQRRRMSSRLPSIAPKALSECGCRSYGKNSEKSAFRAFIWWIY